MYEKSLEMGHFLVFRYPAEPKLARSWAAGVARDGKMKQTPVKSFNQVTEMGVVGSRKKVTRRVSLVLLVVV